MRVGAAAAPRWWGIEPSQLPDYLGHLSASGATSVEFIVHHGRATRDPSTVHLDRSAWRFAVEQATLHGLHVDVHNSLDPRFRLERWTTDRDGFQGDLRPVIDLLADIGQRQAGPPVFVVHAADRCDRPESATSEALAWLAEELEQLRSGAVACVELRSRSGLHDHRFDRDRDRLVAFVEEQSSPAIGMCWDVANEWLSATRSGRQMSLPDEMPSCVRHVHLHGSTSDGSLHAPLGDGNVPWAAALGLLEREQWGGSATLEIRYRLAHEIGDPWTVLAESVRQALSVRI
jgi:sugar phosphate isomerase/epimerase